MELYCGARPETCLGCGGPIVSGDVVIPAERSWLLCLDCGAGLMLGRQLAAWPGPEGGMDRMDGMGTGDAADRQAAIQAHPGRRPSWTWREV